MRDRVMHEWSDDDPRRLLHLATFNSATHAMAIVAGAIDMARDPQAIREPALKPAASLRLTCHTQAGRSRRA
jgi:hypothetical protein